MSKRTIIEIAERVGVSPATVSRALNNVPGVSPDKRRQIVAVANELNYHPNAIARSLQGQRTNTVAYVADVSNRPAADLLFKDFITVLAERCARFNLDLLIHPATNGAANLADLARLLRSGRADGLILADTRQHDQRLKLLAEQNLSFIAFGRSAVDVPYAYVDVDGELGIYTATRHLIERGHRRIAFLGMPLDYSYALHRRDGYLRAMREFALPVDPQHFTVALTNESEARLTMERLLALPEPPTAFVAASDMLAIYAMSVAMNHGLLAGRDYAITGFDDLPLAAHTAPPLTTMQQPFDQVCDELIAMFLRVLGNEPGPRQVLLPPQLIVRATA
ncbi:MAG TPA: LacI family DNA-binding transcriptional regulator [Kouleothrix sp.]|uniref:LacI family DNA-binding transcriptional regulator n=1 Tax=Kouleothrix sp. TaxID=2779161 RepID=UPI002BC29339|nr:LacI family DNA-binding transcriptional regulator [Kouleothrix sp.]HRC74268.1 LacI family DNA-binding transcriptional regulator [Kouleothrix sp.]